jgi:sulfur-carrier protein
MRVFIPTPLRSYTGGAAVVEAQGPSLLAVVDALDRAYPGFKFRVIDEQGQIRTHIKLFVASELVHDLATGVSERDDVHVICALSGG